MFLYVVFFNFYVLQKYEKHLELQKNEGKVLYIETIFLISQFNSY
jgi:hypothetical protein